jgi:hypothetical protein
MIEKNDQRSNDYQKTFSAITTIISTITIIAYKKKKKKEGK